MSEQSYQYQAWPAWAEGPNGERQIFNSEGEVPKGWKHHVGATKAAEHSAATIPAASSPAQMQAVVATEQQANGPVGNDQTTPAALETAQAGPVAEPTGAKVDAAGVAFDPARHTGTLTKAGLWRMKVGVRRPENESVVVQPTTSAPEGEVVRVDETKPLDL